MTTIIKGIAGRYWWVLALRGALLVAFGALALFWPGVTILVLATLFGIFAIIDGIGEITHAVMEKAHGRGWAIFQGALAVVAGFIALFWPGITALALLLIVAFWSLVGGFSGITGSLRMRKAGAPNWGWRLVFSLFLLLFGISLIVNPGAGLLTLSAVIGIWALIVGIFLLMGGFGARKLSRTP